MDSQKSEQNQQSTDDIDIDTALDQFLRSKWKERVNKVHEYDPPNIDIWDPPINRFK